MSQDKDYLDVNFKLPDMPNDAPISDRQKDAVRAVFLDAYDPSNITMGQASLLLDVAYYMNGVIGFLRKHTNMASMPTQHEMLYRVVGVEAIMNDDTLRKDVHKWGRDEYSLGRSTKLPEHDPRSELFQRVFKAVTARISSLSDEIEAR